MDNDNTQGELRKLQQNRERLVNKLTKMREKFGVMSLSHPDRESLELDIKDLEEELNEVRGQIGHYQETLLYESLTELDYTDQENLFLSFSRKYCIGAFILHGSGYLGSKYLGYSVRMLLKRLVAYSQSITTPLMQYDLSSESQSSDITALWCFLARKVGLGTSSRREDIIKQVCKKLQSQNVILILNRVDHIPESHLQKIINEFWEPLAAEVRKVRRSSSSFLLLMFLVDHSGNANGWEICCTRQPDQTWEPHVPIRLPTVTMFSNSNLSEWICRYSNKLLDILPDDLRQGPLEAKVQRILAMSNNGVPDLVMSHICSLCDFDLGGAEEWLKL